MTLIAYRRDVTLSGRLLRGLAVLALIALLGTGLTACIRTAGTGGSTASSTAGGGTGSSSGSGSVVTQLTLQGQSGTATVTLGTVSITVP